VVHCLDNTGFDSWHGRRFFSSPKCANQLWRPCSHLLNVCWWAFNSQVKWPGCEADHSLPTSAKVKKEWRYISAPNISVWHVHRQLCLYTYSYRTTHKTHSYIYFASTLHTFIHILRPYVVTPRGSHLWKKYYHSHGSDHSWRVECNFSLVLHGWMNHWLFNRAVVQAILYWMIWWWYSV
jgi:hypothetical protein